MGALAVLTMAENAPPTDPATRPAVHPFFVKNRPATPVGDKPVVNDPPNATTKPDLPANTTAGGEHDDGAAENPATHRGRRRKADENTEEDTSKKPRPKKRTRNSAGAGIADHFVKLAKGAEGDLPSDPDRSGMESPMPNDQLSSHIVEEIGHGEPGPLTDGSKVEASANTTHGPVNNGCVSGPTAVQATEVTPAKPKRMLLFNPKTGTIGSPPKPKETAVAAEEDPDDEKKLTGRRGRKPASKIVCIAYGKTGPETRIRLSELINNILNGQTQHPVANPKQPHPSRNKKPSPKAPTATAPKSSKATHPFFTGQSKKSDPIAADPIAADPKPKKPAASPISARTKHYTSTPFSPRKPRPGPASKIPMPQFGVKSLGLKFPGAKTPAWPWQGMGHVRGDESEAPGLEDDSLPLPFRKSKGNAVKIPPSESIISLAADSMDLPALAEATRNISTDEFIPPPPELRLPQKHFESGSVLQSRILPELRTFQPSLPAKTSALPKDHAQRGEGKVQAPAQLKRLFDSISSSLSAFDMSQCETANWVQKYAPTSAVEVLQPGQEAFFMRDWLQALMVQSVDTGSAEADKLKAGAKVKGAGAGKKKRRKKLDGFIVSSEDEGYEWYEPSDEDDDWAPSGSRGIFRKTVVRSGNFGKGKDGDKTANTLVISGPHGCGKTAAVYAVAKELDFEVFEINPSSRRSGKDVLEKIGDMTRNHHVRQHQSTSAPNDQGATADDNTAQDIKSGKQSTMNAFFKAKNTGAQPKQAAKVAVKAPQNEVKKESPKNQRQSLILLEEADILYEEDKQFWTTIVTLIAQAKRPFILTCNDETLVPLHTLTLHGIFRLSTAPRDLAVDRLLLIAANEGHALTRQSVEQLYDSRNRDLRGATMDLQYWCQIGVGDRRGGFDWFYSRWPKGVDRDENNEVIRVVSRDTYLPGMNLLGRDSLVDSKLAPRLVEEEVLHQTWESWGLDLGHWQDSVGLGAWAEGLGAGVTSRVDQLGTLEAYDGLAEAMSAADVCSYKSFAAFKEVSPFRSMLGIPRLINDQRRPSTAPNRTCRPRRRMTSFLVSHISPRQSSRAITASRHRLHPRSSLLPSLRCSCRARSFRTTMCLSFKPSAKPRPYAASKPASHLHFRVLQPSAAWILPSPSTPSPLPTLPRRNWHPTSNRPSSTGP